MQQLCDLDKPPETRTTQESFSGGFWMLEGEAMQGSDSSHIDGFKSNPGSQGYATGQPFIEDFKG